MTRPIWPALLIAAILATLSGCAGGDRLQRPAWLDGSDGRYPANRFLSGVGEAKTVDDARDRARADLAKTFEVRISSDSRDTQSYIRKQSGDVIDTDTSLSVRRNIETRSEQLVRGVEIADTWHDPDTGRYYALAVLSRSSAAQRLRQEVARLDDATAQSLRQAAREQDPLRRAGFLNRAVALQLERAAAQQGLAVVDISGRGSPPRRNVKTLAGELRAALAQITIRSDTHGPATAANSSDTVVRGAIAAAGFSVADDDAGDYILTTVLDSTDLGVSDGWHWMRGTLEITLRDAGSREVRGSKRWPLKVAVPVGSTLAAQRLLNKVDATLKEELRAVLLGFTGI